MPRCQYYCLNIKASQRTIGNELRIVMESHVMTTAPCLTLSTGARLALISVRLAFATQLTQRSLGCGITTHLVHVGLFTNVSSQINGEFIPESQFKCLMVVRCSQLTQRCCHCHLNYHQKLLQFICSPRWQQALCYPSDN